VTLAVGTLGGVGLGLAAAVGLSISYFCSKLFVIRRGNAVLRLLVLGHLIMGVISAAALPFLWRPAAPPLSVVLWPLVKVSIFYLLAQAAFFLALRYDDASRLSPLLGLKILMLALMYLLWLHVPLGPMHWAGALLSVVAALLLAHSGKRMTAPAILAVLLACLFYCLSDLNIGWLVDVVLKFTPNPITAALLSVALTYVVCGLIALALLPVAGMDSLKEWQYALPFAISWLSAMCFLFACFNTIGVLYGNLIQATRGLMTVVMGAAIGRLGFVRIEPVMGRVLFVRRVLAALLMFLAIAVYLLAGFAKV
jgi:hypothetical protein